MDLEQIIIDSTSDLFITMLGVDISPLNIPGSELPTETFHNCVSGVVGFSGRSEGVLAFHSPEPVACSLTENFLGAPSPEVDNEVLDAVGEMTNIIAGGVKSALAENGKDVQLSVPSTIQGKAYQLHHLTEAKGVYVHFSSPGGNFFVELHLGRKG